MRTAILALAVLTALGGVQSSPVLAGDSRLEALQEEREERAEKAKEAAEKKLEAKKKRAEALKDRLD